MAESAAQNVACGVGSRVTVTNSSGVGDREFRVTNPSGFSPIVIPDGTAIEFHCKDTLTFTLFCSSGCSSTTVLTQVPRSVIRSYNNFILDDVPGLADTDLIDADELTGVLSGYVTPASLTPYATIEYVDSVSGGGGDVLPLDQALMGLAGIVCAALIAWAIMRAL